MAMHLAVRVLSRSRSRSRSCSQNQLEYQLQDALPHLGHRAAQELPAGDHDVVFGMQAQSGNQNLVV